MKGDRGPASLEFEEKNIVVYYFGMNFWILRKNGSQQKWRKGLNRSDHISCSSYCLVGQRVRGGDGGD